MIMHTAVARLSARHANAEVVGTGRRLGRVLAKLERAFFSGDLRQVSGQFRVLLAIGLNRQCCNFRVEAKVDAITE